MSDALISEVILPKTRAQLQFQVDIKLEKNSLGIFSLIWHD